MSNFPLFKIEETRNVVIQDPIIERYVFTIALVWPSSRAVAELNDG